nr:RNA-directed DNA polymerase, eukaryota [Tanacetum cinerariifolium]
MILSMQEAKTVNIAAELELQTGTETEQQLNQMILYLENLSQSLLLSTHLSSQNLTSYHPLKHPHKKKQTLPPNTQFPPLPSQYPAKPPSPFTTPPAPYINITHHKRSHGLINKKRFQLSIREIFANGDWLTDPKAVKDTFRDHFAARFKLPDSSRLKVNMQFPKRLSNDQVGVLDSGVTRAEIREAIWGCGFNKSPGPDGYTFEFFRRYCNIIGSDFCDAVEGFFDDGFFPKVRWDFLLDVLQAFGFGPNWCKWIRSIFTSAMASVLINGSPTSEFLFFCGLKQGDPLAPFLFILFAKAYDSVRWDFLLDVLQAFGFGDPLAPFLFILVMESLHILVSKASNEGVFKGLQLHESVAIFHLFYADDVVFIGEWSEGNLENLVRILNCFYLALGLKINLQKSYVLGVRVPYEDVRHGASLIGCDVMRTPFKYLVVTVGDFMSRNSSWVNVIQKTQSRLSKWKSKTLSVSGRLTLVKSVLVIKAIYGSSFGTHSVKYSSIWCSILREVQVLSGKGFDFVSHVKKRVGNGQNTKFWLDTWILDSPLSVRFPRLFALDSDKQVLVASKWVASGFNASFRREIRDGVEHQQWTDMLSILGTVILSPSFDRWICDLNGDGTFRVKDIRAILDDMFLPSASEATSVSWPNLCFFGSVVGGISIGVMLCLLVIGIHGSLRFSCLQNLNLCWRVCLLWLGGTYGLFGIKLFSMMLLLDVMCCSMTLFRGPLCGELEECAVTLLKRIRKFSMTQDVGARVAVHIFNRIGFSIAKEVGTQIVSRLPSNLL